MLTEIIKALRNFKTMVLVKKVLRDDTDSFFPDHLDSNMMKQFRGYALIVYTGIVMFSTL